MDYAAKGRDFQQQAEKKLKGGAFSRMFSGSSREEAAAELLERAATQFKLAKAWNEAGQVFEQLTGLHAKLESNTDAAAAWVEASRAYSKAGATDKSGQCLRRAVEMYTSMGRLGMAARHLKGLAEEAEKADNKTEAMELYEQAGSMYATEDSTSEASKCLLKVALFKAELGDYAAAIKIFEDVGRRAADNNLLRFSARGHLLNAGLCHLAGSDEIAIQRAIEKYEDIDLQFAGSREGNLLKDLAADLEAGEGQSFADHLAEFDSMTRLDKWKTTLLLKVKKRIEEGDEDDLDLS
mmetsp:Transcript_21207/g.63819  ORF Transcript_21207/g.63819 Transcript_21207/m.63819 type:complete len:295 (-) Transcript_21207:1757-2641(-)